MIKVKRGDYVRIKNYGMNVPLYWCEEMQFYMGQIYEVQFISENGVYFMTDGFYFKMEDIQEVVKERQINKQVTWDFTTNIFENGFD
jgi:hypothetical protein